ncbi:hypothetical protein FQZ97_672950 [compost metagenome]
MPTFLTARFQHFSALVAWHERAFCERGGVRGREGLARDVPGQCAGQGMAQWLWRGGAHRQHGRRVHAELSPGAPGQGLGHDPGIPFGLDRQHVGDHGPVQCRAQRKGQEPFAVFGRLAGAGQHPGHGPQLGLQGGGGVGGGCALQHLDAGGAQGQVVARHAVRQGADREQPGLVRQAQGQRRRDGVGPAAHRPAADGVLARSDQHRDLVHWIAFALRAAVRAGLGMVRCCAHGASLCCRTSSSRACIRDRLSSITVRFARRVMGADASRFTAITWRQSLMPCRCCTAPEIPRAR